MKKDNKQPLVSVVMPVYNAGDFLVESVNSILQQTYKNFEFIIVDDRSTDDSWIILGKLAAKDKRIRTYRLKKSAGVSETVKFAIAKTRGKFIARMDADDVSLPKRLELQVKYLLHNPKTVAVGGQCSIINKEGELIGEKRFPIKNKDIYSYIFKFVPVQQPTLMIAKTRLPKDFEYYHDGLNTAEEIELLFKLFQFGKVENLKEIVLLYRLHENNTSLKNIKSTFFFTLLSRIKAILQYGYRPSVTGLLVTFIQLIAVSVLPQKTVFWLYEKSRKMLYSMKYSRIGLRPAGGIR